jgi:hypothetical protein
LSTLTVFQSNLDAAVREAAANVVRYSD